MTISDFGGPERTPSTARDGGKERVVVGSFADTRPDAGRFASLGVEKKTVLNGR